MYSGFAYVGGACVVNKRLEKVNSVAIIEDTGGFSGIIVAAHEVGHLYVLAFIEIPVRPVVKKFSKKIHFKSFTDWAQCTMVHRRLLILADRERRNAVGKTGT